MYLFGIVVLVAVSQIGVGLAGPVTFDDVTKDTELLFVLLLHRHGDRTPETLASINSYSSNPEAVIAAANYYGYGQLTKQGKEHAYRLGQNIRNRYNDFIAPRFNDSEVYLQSTAYTRTRMTLLTALSAVFPAIPGESWSDTINWEPVPYKSGDLTYDINMAFVNCPTFLNSFIATLFTKPAALAPYSEVLEKVSNILNLPTKLQDTPVFAIFVYDVLRSQVNLGIPLSEDLEDLFPQLQEAAGVAFAAAYGDPSNVDLLQGVLLKEFFDYSTKVINGEATPKVRWYSAHDANVEAFENILKLTPRPGIPLYTSLITLELRKDASGKLFVLPVYVPSPEDEPLYLRVEGCDSVLCSLDQFTEILSPHTLDLNTWRTKCNWVETL